MRRTLALLLVGICIWAAVIGPGRAGAGVAAYVEADPSFIDLPAVPFMTTRTLTVTVSTTGTGSASGTVASDRPWLRVWPPAFAGPSTTLTLTVDPAGQLDGWSDLGTVTLTIAGMQALVAVSVSVIEPEFSDVPRGHWAYAAVQTMRRRGVIAGFPDGSFHPGEAVTREQFAKLLATGLGLSLLSPSRPTFSDVPADRWSYKYVEAVASLMPAAAAGPFRPTDPALREEVAAALGAVKGTAGSGDLAAQFSDAGNIAVALRPQIFAAVQAGLVKGFEDGTFRPQESVTRAQAAVLLQRAAP